MSILSSELKAYQAANHAEDDVSTQGGAIATAGKAAGAHALPDCRRRARHWDAQGRAAGPSLAGCRP